MDHSLNRHVDRPELRDLNVDDIRLHAQSHRGLKLNPTRCNYIPAKPLPSDMRERIVQAVGQSMTLLAEWQWMDTSKATTTKERYTNQVQV